MNVLVQTLDDEEEEGRGESKVHKTFITLDGFPRRKLLSASSAEQAFKQAVLEASAELSQEFGGTYLDKVVKGSLGPALDLRQPDTSYETLKKGFLFYLNASGKYLVLREHLREAVVAVLHQKSMMNHYDGFKSREQYQSYLHESYSFLLDSLNDALHSTAFEETTSHGIMKCVKTSKKDVRGSKRLRDMLLYAQEALAQGEFENAQRIHTERIARSGDADNCWIDFALMWISHGDDRLAEIAVREALARNPANLVGLLLSALIAGRHWDQRAISYMQALLHHRPLCPELHVCMAIIQSHLGDEIAAESYYDTGKKIHGILTTSTGVMPMVQDDEVKSDKSKGSSESKMSKQKKQNKPNKGEKKRGRSGDTTKSQTTEGAGDAPQVTKEKRKNRRGTKPQESPGSHPSSIDTENLYGKSAQKKGDETTGGGDQLRVQSSLKVAETELKITKMNFAVTKPPTLSTDIIVGWNVTKKQVEKKQPAEYGHPDNPYREIYGELNTDEIQQEFNKVLEAEANQRPQDPPRRHRLHAHHHRHRHHKRPQETDTSSDNTTDVIYVNNAGDKSRDPSVSNQPVDELEPREITGTLKKSSDVQQGSVYSQRSGSELMWTAYLLLKLRQFDFLDLILAKEVSRGTRSLEYLYLRALSLQLRGHDTEALEVITEALAMNSSLAPFWILKGHSLYNLGDKEEALASYERAMMLPHGKESLHLAYLRFGAVCAAQGAPELAKRVFLKRVTSTPTPGLWILIGTACFQHGELDEALHAFSEANKLDPTNPTIWAHLSLVSLEQGNKNLAEQSYKWAIRYGLKKGKLMDEIKELHIKLGFGDASFPKLPQCIPHEVFVQRLGRETPLELYADALNFPHLKTPLNPFENVGPEQALIMALRKKDKDRLNPSRKKGADEISPDEDQLEETGQASPSATPLGAKGRGSITTSHASGSKLSKTSLRSTRSTVRNKKKKPKSGTVTEKRGKARKV